MSILKISKGSQSVVISLEHEITPEIFNILHDNDYKIVPTSVRDLPYSRRNYFGKPTAEFNKFFEELQAILKPIT